MVVMPLKSLVALAALVVAFAVGCSAPPAPAETGTPATLTAELAKCAGCGKEVAKAELAMHDGQMLCKDCIAAHNH